MGDFVNKYIEKNSKETGLSLGTPVHTGAEKNKKTKITLFDYNEQSFQEKQVKTVDECLLYTDTPTVTWINVAGIQQVEVIKKIGESFGLHPLLVEDVLNTNHRPKMEDFGERIYIILKMLFFNSKTNKVVTEQVSLVLGPNYVLSFQEREGEIFNQIRERIRSGLGRIRKLGADYLFYALLDSVVDGYFVVMEKLGEKIDFLEEKLVTNPSPVTLKSIHNLKIGMIFLNKSVLPLREAISGLERGESPLIKEYTGIYLRDVYEHTIHVIDTIDTYRDMATGMLDIYLSSVNIRISEVMKVLTIIATIFIPLTFIVGVYGMNFKYMPELEWRWGYPAIWLVMIIIVVLMGIYFKRRKWL